MDAFDQLNRVRWVDGDAKSHASSLVTAASAYMVSNMNG